MQLSICNSFYTDDTWLGILCRNHGVQVLDILNDKKENAAKKIIDIIRNKIKFRNILITDDISMGGLKHSIEKNTIKAFSAGCNLVLHCNGKMSEMNVVGQNSPYIDDFIIKKTSKLIQIIS